MRIAVYNQHWSTAGGGERFAGGIAEALARRPGRQVSLVAHAPIDTDALSQGATGLLVFNTAGTYTYHCKIHQSQMKDFTVVVS